MKLPGAEHDGSAGSRTGRALCGNEVGSEVRADWQHPPCSRACLGTGDWPPPGVVRRACAARSGTPWGRPAQSFQRNGTARCLRRHLGAICECVPGPAALWHPTPVATAEPPQMEAAAPAGCALRCPGRFDAPGCRNSQRLRICGRDVPGTGITVSHVPEAPRTQKSHAGSDTTIDTAGIFIYLRC